MGRKADRRAQAHDDNERLRAAKLLEALKDPDEAVRMLAAHSLGGLRIAATTATVEALVECLKADKDAGVRKAAAQAICDQSSAACPQSVALADHIYDEDPEVGECCFTALCSSKVMRTLHVAKLAQCLTDQRVPAFVGRSSGMDTAAGFHMHVIRVLGQIGGAAAPYTAEVAPFLGDPARAVASTAALALSKMGPVPERHLPLVAQALARLESGHALVRMFDYAAVEAVKPFAHVLADRIVRSYHCNAADLAAKVLCKGRGLGGASASAVAQHLDDPAREVRSRAIKVMCAAGVAAAPHAEALARRLNDQEFNIRVAAIRALGSLGEAAVPYAADLVRCLGDGQFWSIRLEAARCLGDGQFWSIRLEAARCLGDGQFWSIRLEAARCLGDGQFWSIRLEAARALGLLGRGAAPEAAEPLGRVAEQDHHAKVREAAEVAKHEIQRPMRVVALYPGDLTSDGLLPVTCMSLAGQELAQEVAWEPTDAVRKLREHLAKALQESAHHLRLVALDATILEDEEPIRVLLGE